MKDKRWEILLKLLVSIVSQAGIHSDVNAKLLGKLIDEVEKGQKP